MNGQSRVGAADTRSRTCRRFCLLVTGRSCILAASLIYSLNRSLCALVDTKTFPVVRLEVSEPAYIWLILVLITANLNTEGTTTRESGRPESNERLSFHFVCSQPESFDKSYQRNLSQRKQAIYRWMCFCTLFNGRDAGTRRLSRNARQHPRYAWLHPLCGPWDGLLVTRPSNTLALLPSDATPLIPTRLQRLPAQSWPYVFADNRCYFNTPAASETLPFRR